MFEAGSDKLVAHIILFTITISTGQKLELLLLHRSVACYAELNLDEKIPLLRQIMVIVLLLHKMIQKLSLQMVQRV